MNYPITHGGGGEEIELRLFNWFGLQTGINFIGFPVRNEAIVQLPVLARFNLAHVGPALYLSPYVGMGINLSSSSSISPIIGFETGLRGNHFSLFYGGRVQNDFLSSSHFYYINSGGFGYYVPFRRH